MTKLSFLMLLRGKLSDLPQSEVEERLGFYAEMIEDRVEDGLSEEDAVLAVGSVDEIAAQIAADIAVSNGTKDKISAGRRMKAWEVILLILGVPVWLPLLISAVAVAVSLYVVLWAVVLSLWAVVIALVCAVFGGLVIGAYHALAGDGLAAIAIFGAVTVCAGTSVLLFIGTKAATKGSAVLAVNAVRRLSGHGKGRVK